MKSISEFTLQECNASFLVEVDRKLIKMSSSWQDIASRDSSTSSRIKVGNLGSRERLAAHGKAGSV